MQVDIAGSQSTESSLFSASKEVTFLWLFYEIEVTHAYGARGGWFIITCVKFPQIRRYKNNQID